MKEVLPSTVEIDNVDVWFQDESRVGQQGSQTRIWAPKGTRPRVVKQQQFLSVYIYGAVCPVQGLCAGLILPEANKNGLEKHLKEISYHVPEGRHAVVLMDQAGYHKAGKIIIPKNISILYLPPRSPELNSQENVWKYIKDHSLANRTFKNIEEIINACSSAWNCFADSKKLIISLTGREWAKV